MALNIKTQALAGFESPEGSNLSEEEEEARQAAGQEEEEEEEEQEEPAGGEEEEEEEEEEGGEGDEDSDTVINTISQAFGIETGKQYENTEEGLTQYANDVIETARQQALEDEYTRMPLLKAFKEHLEQGYSIDTFLKEQSAVDYKSIQLNEDDESQLKQVITQRYKAEGLSDKTIDRLIKASELDGVLFEDAQESLNVLDQLQKEEVEAQKAEEARIAQERQKENEKTLATVKNLVNTGKLLNLNIPNTERNKFLEFITSPDRAGRTEANKKWEELSLEQRLYIDYLLYKGLKVPTVQKGEQKQKGTLGAGSRMFKSTGKRESGGNVNDLGKALRTLNLGK